MAQEGRLRMTDFQRSRYGFKEPIVPIPKWEQTPPNVRPLARSDLEAVRPIFLKPVAFPSVDIVSRFSKVD